jgi:hypothetical protein
VAEASTDGRAVKPESSAWDKKSVLLSVCSHPAKEIHHVQLWTSVGIAANHVGVPVANSDAMALTTAPGLVKARF